MKVTPATKNGFLLLKSSMAISMDSKFILLDASSIGAEGSEAKQERGKDRLMERKERWVFRERLRKEWVLTFGGLKCKI